LQRPAELLAARLEIMLQDDVGGPVSRHLLHEFQPQPSARGA